MSWRKNVDKRLKQLECNHEHWEYDRIPYPFFSILYPAKTCKSCGKTVYLPIERWLQEQADLHYKRHENFIDALNRYYEERYAKQNNIL